MLCLLLPIRSNAQMAVFDGAVFAQTYQNYLQLISQIEILQEQASYLEESLNAIKTLGSGQYQWSNVSEQINQLGSVIQSANGISYSAQNVGSQFQKAYPGYQSPKDFNQTYQQSITTTMNTLNGALQSLNMSAEDFTNEPKRIAFLQSQIQNAHGQTQALQASAQISTEVISQLQLLRQTLMSQENAQNGYYAQQLQTQASNEAGFNQMIKNGNTHFVPYGALAR
jgi:type IV secretion system protein TrbJ